MNVYNQSTEVGFSKGFTRHFKGALMAFAIICFAVIGVVGVGMYTTYAAGDLYAKSDLKAYIVQQREDLAIALMSDRQRESIRVIVADNAKLTVQNAELQVVLASTVAQLKVAVAAQTQAETKLQAALIPESTVKAAFVAHVYKPSERVAHNVYASVSEVANSAEDKTAEVYSNARNTVQSWFNK